MNCKRCAQGPLEYIYRLDWTDIFYCPDCNLEHKVDIRNNLELVDQDLVSWEEKLFSEWFERILLVHFSRKFQCVLVCHCALIIVVI